MINNHPDDRGRARRRLVPPAPSDGRLTSAHRAQADAGSSAGGAFARWAEAEAADVVAFWRGLGLPGLIDVHVHFMPANVMAKVWSYLEGAGTAAGHPWPIVYRASEEDRVALLGTFGVRAFSALAYPHKPRMAEWLNAWTAQFAARTPPALHTATFFPEPGAAGYVAQAIAGGARMFKAHFQVGGYDPRDELLEPVWGQLAEAGLPVVVHCGSGPVPGRFTGPGPMTGVLAHHPRLTAIIAHMGSPEYAEFLDLAGRYPAVYLDTTMAFTDFMRYRAPFPAQLRARLADAGDRIVLGTDFPNIPYRYQHQLDSLARLELGPHWLRAVCHDNAARLLGLPQPASPRTASPAASPGGGPDAETETEPEEQAREAGPGG